MHIYVASSWRNTYYPEVVQALRVADILSSLHNDLLKSDTSTGYVITKVTTAPKSKKIETIRDAAGVVFGSITEGSHTEKIYKSCRLTKRILTDNQ